MNSRIKKKHLKQYLVSPNPYSILVFEVDMDKINFIDVCDYFQDVTKCLPCGAIVIPKGMQIKAMGKDEAIKHLTKIINSLGDLS